MSNHHHRCSYGRRTKKPRCGKPSTNRPQAIQLRRNTIAIRCTSLPISRASAIAVSASMIMKAPVTGFIV